MAVRYQLQEGKFIDHHAGEWVKTTDFSRADDHLVRALQFIGAYCKDHPDARPFIEQLNDRKTVTYIG